MKYPKAKMEALPWSKELREIAHLPIFHFRDDPYNHEIDTKDPEEVTPEFVSQKIRSTFYNNSGNIMTSMSPMAITVGEAAFMISRYRELVIKEVPFEPWAGRVPQYREGSEPYSAVAWTNVANHHVDDEEFSAWIMHARTLITFDQFIELTVRKDISYRVVLDIVASGIDTDLLDSVMSN